MNTVKRFGVVIVVAAFASCGREGSGSGPKNSEMLSAAGGSVVSVHQNRMCFKLAPAELTTCFRVTGHTQLDGQFSQGDRVDVDAVEDHPAPGLEGTLLSVRHSETT